MKYIALLRGINVGGNNMVAMTDLKKCFEELGFTNVSTYINSGNVFFETSKTDKVKLVQECEDKIESKFGFKVVCSVISADELKNAMKHAPKWWGDDAEVKHNAIFVIAPKTVDEVMSEVGEAKLEFEKVEACAPVIFWSAPLKTFNRTRYKGIVGSKTYKSVTIRNANTARKLLKLVE